jgi:hypothetical protein
MHQRSIITDTKFVYADKRDELRGKLKYFQFRDDKDGASHVRQFDEDGERVRRWIDRGLGDEHWQIFQNCEALATDDLQRNVSARMLVIAPEVHMMQAIPEERRIAVLEELTAQTVENWFERMAIPTPDHSFVIHESKPSDSRPDGRLKDEDDLSESYLHSHVVLAPTVQGLERARETYGTYREQIHELHQAGRDAMQMIWERELGVERVAELEEALEARAQRYQELDEAHAREFFASRDYVPELEADMTPNIMPEIDDDWGLEIE